MVTNNTITIKSNPFLFTFQKAVIYVGCLSIVQAIIIFVFELLKANCVFKEKVYWLGIESLLDIFLCSILIYGAIQEKHFYLVPWITYSAFKCVFGFIDLLLLVYKNHVAYHHQFIPFPTIYFFQILISNIALFFSWMIVVRYFNERRNAVLKADNLEFSPSSRPIYTMSYQTKPKPNWV